MKNYVNWVMGLLVVVSISIGCDKDDTVPVTNANLEQELNNSERGLFFPWDYVMDWRYSRAECATGPGVCFRNGYGDIFRMYTKPGDDYVSEVTRFMDRLMADNDDPDDGLIVFSIEGNTLRLIFSRALEEDVFIVEEDQVIRGELAERLGREQISIPAGEYEVHYGSFEHGESYINVE